MMWDLEHLKWAAIRTVVNTSLYIRSSSWSSPATQPDRVKSYRHDLFASRIFISRGHNGQDDLPLVIRAHGGGFIVNNPAVDDPIARYLADHVNCIVVSIDYRKAPQNKFPTAHEDVIEQTLNVIEDRDLPVDRSRVVLCGSSAGANLFLGAVQDSRLRAKVLGAASICPLVDLVPDGDAKMTTRPDPSVPDFMGNSYAGLSEIYFDAAQMPSMTDPRVSPIYFADRESLPPRVLLIGAEHDMFCHEDEAMANKIAALNEEAKVHTKAGWRTSEVQWHKIHGQPHAFDAFPAKTPEKETERVAAVDELYSVISEWLTEVFSEGSRQGT